MGELFPSILQQGNGSIDQAELPYHTHSTCYCELYSASRHQLRLQFRLRDFKSVASSVMTNSPTLYSENSMSGQRRFTLSYLFSKPFCSANTISTPDKWVPVTTALRVLRLRLEEWSPIRRVDANILNKQPRTADKGRGNCMEQILLQKLTFGQFVNKSSQSLTKPKGSWPCSQKPVTGYYSEPN
jgi:hypothetical protein